MSPERSEKEQLERHLRGDSALSRAYHAASDELPAPELDRTILEEARRAVGRARRRWLVPTSVAAAVLASLGLATFVLERGAVAPPSAEAPAPYARDRALERAPEPEAVLRKEAAGEAKTPARDTQVPRSSAPEAPAEAERAGQSSLAEPEAGAVALEPEVWLRRIEALRRGGRLSEAEASLRAFRAHYPNYPIERQGGAR